MSVLWLRGRLPVAMASWPARVLRPRAPHPRATALSARRPARTCWSSRGLFTGCQLRGSLAGLPANASVISGMMKRCCRRKMAAMASAVGPDTNGRRYCARGANGCVGGAGASRANAFVHGFEGSEGGRRAVKPCRVQLDTRWC